MNQATKPLNSLSAEQHRQYLKAMGIAWWIPKNDPIVLPVEEEPTHQPSEPPSQAQASSKPQPQNESIKTAQTPTAAANPDTNPQEDKDLDLSQIRFNVTQQLKMVKWQSAEGSKSLLIICRHKTDQPAKSFAQGSSPSQFMQDFILALNRFNVSSKNQQNLQNNPAEGDTCTSDFSCHLAHIAEAGIGDNNQPLNQVLENLKPDLLLVLGEESIYQLCGKRVAVASLRGRMIDLQGYKSLVSYHPYSLISNPALKRLAFEDLRLIYQYLNPSQPS